MIFTRYLYVKDEVKLSLLNSILNRNESVLFWTYELYYSGFEEELFEYLLKIYYDFYYTINPSFLDYFIKKYNLWKECEDDEKDIIVGMIAKNLSIRNYNLDIFILNNSSYNNNNNNSLMKSLEEKNYREISNIVLNKIIGIPEIIKISVQYFKKKCIKIKEFLKMKEEIQVLGWIMSNYQKLTNNTSKKIYIVLDSEDILDYKNIEKKDGLKSYKILEKACKYETHFVLDRDRDISLKECYWYKWLYYASFSPLWKLRIERYGGIINKEKKEVLFIDEESFYDEYGYEPDEQPKEVQEKSIKEIKQKINWRQFYEEKKENNLIDNFVFPSDFRVNYTS